MSSAETLVHIDLLFGSQLRGKKCQVACTLFFFFLHDHLLESLKNTKSFKNNQNPLKAHRPGGATRAKQSHVLGIVLGTAAGPPLQGSSRCRNMQRECASLLSTRWCSFTFFFSFFSLRFMTCSLLLHKSLIQDLQLKKKEKVVCVWVWMDGCVCVYVISVRWSLLQVSPWRLILGQFDL